MIFTEKLIYAIYLRLIDMGNNINVNKDVGICENLKYYVEYDKDNKFFYDNIDHWLTAQFDLWPECHKHENGQNLVAAPVDGYAVYDNEYEQGTLWYNPKRQRLLSFLIKQAEKQLEEKETS